MKSKYKGSKLMNRLGIFLPVLVSVIVFVSCSPISVQPGLKIQDQKEVSAGDITISVDISDFNLSNDVSKSIVQGRVIYYMDVSVPTYYDHLAISKAGTYAIEASSSYTWKDVTPGEHIFSAQLVNSDNKPLPIPVVDSLTLNVGAPKGQPKLDIVNPTEGAQLPAGSILISVDVTNFIISQDGMGVVNRKGEGHLIYYIDEAPPVVPGVPASSHTSTVSTSLSYLWKPVSVGKHTFSAQLVNNDDTPLDIPVAVTISVDVQP